MNSEYIESIKLKVTNQLSAKILTLDFYRFLIMILVALRQNNKSVNNSINMGKTQKAFRPLSLSNVGRKFDTFNLLIFVKQKDIKI